MKKLTGAPLAILAIFVTWTLLDFVIHGLVLGRYYKALMPLIRPPQDMSLWLLNALMLLMDLVFVGLFYYLNERREKKQALVYGLVMGLLMGFVIGWGTWTVIPIPNYMAWVWFLGTWGEFLVAGGILALTLPKKPTT
ncbi:MAG: hypothetical protein RRB13_03160 [bacterium]|nr:hypothetical protein [bacterium]